VAEKNVEIVRSAYEAFAREDVDGILPLFDEHIEWRNPEDSSDAGVWHGHEGVRDWFAQVREVLGEMRIVPEEFVELPDGRVLVRVCVGFRAPQSGVEMEYPQANLITLRDGLCTRFQMYSDLGRAREVAGLEG
jgi:ketosteroid isomerase-like protein